MGRNNEHPDTNNKPHEAKNIVKKLDCKLELEPLTDSVQAKEATASWKRSKLEDKMSRSTSSEKQRSHSSTDSAWWTKVFEVVSFLSPNWQRQRYIRTSQRDGALVFLIAPNSRSKYAAATFSRCEVAIMCLIKRTLLPLENLDNTRLWWRTWKILHW